MLMRKASCTGGFRAGGLFGADRRKAEDTGYGKDMVRKMGAEEKTVETKSDSMRQEYAFAPDVKLKECKYCRVMIPSKARICPNCKTTLKSYAFWKAAAAVLTIVLIGGAGYLFLAHEGILNDFAVAAWMGQKEPSKEAFAVTSVETPETAAAAKSVESAVAGAGAGDGALKEVSVDADTAAVVQAAESAWVPTVAEETERKEQESGSKEAAEPAAEKPDARDKEETTEKPDARDKEETTEKPDAVEKPETAADSDVAEKPEAAENSDVTEKPDARDKEETTEKPDAVEKPEAADSDAAEKPDADEAAFRTACVNVAYKALLREQEEYLGKAIMLETRVICLVEGGLFDDNTYYLCVAEEKNDIERYYIIRDDRKADTTFVLEGDILTVYGQLFGNCKLPANLIETRPTVPAVSMLYCDLSGE